MNNDQMSLLAAALQRAAATMRGGGTPNDQVAARFGAMQPASQPTPNQYVAQNFPQPTPNQYVAQNFPGPTPNQYVAQNFPQPPHTPMPMARPHQMAPQAPSPAMAGGGQAPMSFFQRNAAMMRDPVTGMFIDPGGGAQAQAGGPDLIGKMMALLHNKANTA